MNQNGGLKQINRPYKAYRQAQIARAERAVPYSKFLEQRYTVSIVRNVAMTGRMILVFRPGACGEKCVGLFVELFESIRAGVFYFGLQSIELGLNAFDWQFDASKTKLCAGIIHTAGRLFSPFGNVSFECCGPNALYLIIRLTGQRATALKIVLCLLHLSMLKRSHRVRIRVPVLVIVSGSCHRDPFVTQTVTQNVA
jgi:hypothetical protein